ncbi:MAG: xanthine dehydrogenase family protein subunit M [Myxococcales bacterium]|nr:xanthine dehydrogenase family protein subunit M [Myxococcales bacterium]
MEFVRADSPGHALELLSRYGDRGIPLAGGTCTMPSLARMKIRPGALIALDRLSAEFGEIAVGKDSIRVGALTTLESLARHESLPSGLGLCAAAAQAGSWQTRSMGTVGGNICDAAPTADLLPPFLVAGATVHLGSRDRDEREVPLADFLTAEHRTDRRGDELLTAITCPVPPRGTSAFYYKVGRRSAMEVAIVGLAIRVTVDETTGDIRDARLAVSGLGPIPRRFPGVEAMLLGRPSQAALREAAAALAEEAAADDVWATAAYRRAVASRVFLRGARELVADVRRSADTS